MKIIEVIVKQRTGSAPSLLGTESRRALFERGGATGEEGADFRRNGLRSRFTIL